MLTIQRWNANLGSECRLREGDRDHAMQVCTFALEEWMFFYVEHNVEIASGSAEGTSLAQSSKADPRAVFHACRNLGVDRSLPKHSSFALALLARIGNYAAYTLACGAGASHTEKSLLISHLTTTTAGTATHRCRALCCA